MQPVILHLKKKKHISAVSFKLERLVYGNSTAEHILKKNEAMINQISNIPLFQCCAESLAASWTMFISAL